MARRRLGVIDYYRIVQELRAGRSFRAIADSKLASRNTVRHVSNLVESLGWLEPSRPMPEPDEIAAVCLEKASLPPIQESTVARYATEIKSWHEKGHKPTQIHGALERLPGYSGSLSAVKRFIRHLPPTDRQAFVVLHFAPGEAAQVDFGSGPVLTHPVTKKPTRTHFFVMTLCDSRHMYAELVWDQKVETWLRCHRNAFVFFGGVPMRVIIDNLKSAITRATHRDPEVQRSYAEFAAAYGFTIVPCRPRTPRHKGRVERGVAYVKSSFLPLREFRSLDNGNQQLLEWVLESAGNRIHGTTREQPLAAFAEREKAALQPLPACLPELVTWARAKVATNCHLTSDGSFYSAPHLLVGIELDVRMREAMVEIYRDHVLVAMHPRATRHRTFRTNPEHYPPEKVAHMKKTPQWCLRQSEKVGPRCRAFMELLLGDRVLDRLAGAHGVLSLGERFGTARLEAACGRALDYGNITYRAVRGILDKGLDQVPEGEDPTGQLALPMPIAPRFARDIGRLLTS